MGEYRHIQCTAACSALTFEQGVVCWGRYKFFYKNSGICVIRKVTARQFCSSASSRSKGSHSRQGGVIFALAVNDRGVIHASDTISYYTGTLIILNCELWRTIPVNKNSHRESFTQEGIKPGTERNRNCCTIRTWTPDMLRKIGVNMPGLSMYGELISRPVPATKTGQAPSRQYRATPSIWSILAVYLVSSSGVADPSLTSEGSVMSLPSLALDSAVGSGVNSSVAHPGTARQWYRVLYSPHIRNKHHKRASDGMSTSSKLGQLLVYRGDVLPIYS